MFPRKCGRGASSAKLCQNGWSVQERCAMLPSKGKDFFSPRHFQHMVSKEVHRDMAECKVTGESVALCN